MKSKVYFITGDKDKAEYLSKFLGVELGHKKIDLDEIQSMDLKEIVQKKVREAYKVVQAPVIVEDVSLEFKSLGGLPGPFIKFFVDNMNLQDICDLLKDKNRKATAKCVFGYFDGKNEEYFEASFFGEISQTPKGKGGYGWDAIFIPDGYRGRTRAELSPEEDRENYIKMKPFKELKSFLDELI